VSKNFSTATNGKKNAFFTYKVILRVHTVCVHFPAPPRMYGHCTNPHIYSLSEKAIFFAVCGSRFFPCPRQGSLPFTPTRVYAFFLMLAFNFQLRAHFKVKNKRNSDVFIQCPYIRQDQKMYGHCTSTVCSYIARTLKLISLCLSDPTLAL
jgi:hypothetical protein